MVSGSPGVQFSAKGITYVKKGHENKARKGGDFGRGPPPELENSNKGGVGGGGGTGRQSSARVGGRFCGGGGGWTLGWTPRDLFAPNPWPPVFWPPVLFRG